MLLIRRGNFFCLQHILNKFPSSNCSWTQMPDSSSGPTNLAKKCKWNNPRINPGSYLCWWCLNPDDWDSNRWPLPSRVKSKRFQSWTFFYVGIPRGWRWLGWRSRPCPLLLYKYSCQTCNINNNKNNHNKRQMKFNKLKTNLMK